MSPLTLCVHFVTATSAGANVQIDQFDTSQTTHDDDAELWLLRQADGDAELWLLRHGLLVCGSIQKPFLDIRVE